MTNEDVPTGGEAESGERLAASPAAEINVDVAILGAGIAGCAAASTLAGMGISVALIAQHHRHPPEFRAEKVGESLVELLDRAGLGDAARAAMTEFEGAWLHRFGRIVERGHRREFGFDYPTLIDALRQALPPGVDQVVGRSETIETGASSQVVRLRDGRSVRSRLLVVATGLGIEVRRQLGLERVVISPAHTLAAGFTLTRKPDSFPFPSLVWTGERFGDRVSYLTLFPLGGTMRANFYVYRTQEEAWTREFREAPEASLRALMPGLERSFGEIRLAGPVVTRPIDLQRVTGHLRDGLVVVGDAYCTACPVTSNGIGKALADVDRLCHAYVPRWLETPGMARDKIAAYYDDPVKQARDRLALAESLNARSFKVDATLPWRLRRLRSNTLVRLLYHLRSTPLLGRG